MLARSVTTCTRALCVRASSANGSGTSGGGARAVRYVPLKVVTISKGDKDLDAAVFAYLKRCSRYAPMDETTIKQNPKNTRDVSAQKAAEAERVMKVLTPRDYVVLMDERGRDVSSEDLADIVADIGEKGFDRGVFVLGGPFGHGDDVIARANCSIRLSKMVLNHQVARLVLAEALYRAHTILRGEPYHH
jgi:23S rRNA (pseudouridine1915-N3)-methyltransferase